VRQQQQGAPRIDWLSDWVAAVTSVN
jgi:hypothetical protein